MSESRFRVKKTLLFTEDKGSLPPEKAQCRRNGHIFDGSTQNSMQPALYKGAIEKNRTTVPHENVKAFIFGFPD
jgi:hypothetical protein